MLKKSPHYDQPQRGPSRANLITLVFAVLILVPSMIGFVMKFMEFIHTFRDDAAGAFAITPMVNYLLASLGFLCLLLWSVANGMFRDMEKPKQIMLEREAMLDENVKTHQGAPYGG
jgi:hypothetical protein